MSDEDVDIYGDIEADSPSKPKASVRAKSTSGHAAATPPLTHAAPTRALALAVDALQDDAGAVGSATGAHADERADEVIYGDVAPDTRGPDSAAGLGDYTAPAPASRPGEGGHPAAAEAVDKVPTVLYLTCCCDEPCVCRCGCSAAVSSNSGGMDRLWWSELRHLLGCRAVCVLVASSVASTRVRPHRCHTVLVVARDGTLCAPIHFTAFRRANLGAGHGWEANVLGHSQSCSS